MPNGPDSSAHGGVFQGALDVPLDLPLASAGTRALAQLLDLFILSLVLTLLTMGVLGGVVAASSLELVDFETAAISGTVALLVGSFLAQWFYFVGCELSMDGQSPGKLILGLRVVTRDGATVGAVPSLLRNLLRIVDLLPGAYGIGLVVMWLSPTSQRLGDLAAGTLVVREPPDAPRGPQVERWPQGIKPADMALIQDWLRRAPTLDLQRRSALAQGLVTWLDRAWPGFVPAAREGELAEGRLREALAVAEPVTEPVSEVGAEAATTPGTP